MKNIIKHSRREFINRAGLFTSGTMLAMPLCAGKCYPSKELVNKPIRMAIVADAHADLIPDKNERLEKFIAEAIDGDVEFILQLGDFCFPKKENLDFLKIWNQYNGPKYHVLGNHDMDVSNKNITRDFWEMGSNYYSFDHKSLHVVVLDANNLFVDDKYLDYDTANFYVDDEMRTYIDPLQLEWLKSDLENTNLTTIIFSHQSLVNPKWGIKNRVEVQKILEDENRRAGVKKIIACFNGHDHIDFCRTLNGIHYIELNSLSYYWMGAKYSNRERYPGKLYEAYPNLDKMAPYKDPLYAFVEIDLNEGFLDIEGVRSDWLSPSPAETKMPPQTIGSQLSASISDRHLDLGVI